MQITKENLTIIIVTIKSQNIIDACLKSLDPDVKKIIVENYSNREFTESLKEIEILASNGILQESLPLIIDAYYYNQNNSNSSDSILSKWMNKETLPNLIKEELLKIAFQNKHINKDKFLEKLFKTNFNVSLNCPDK